MLILTVFSYGNNLENVFIDCKWSPYYVGFLPSLSDNKEMYNKRRNIICWHLHVHWQGGDIHCLVATFCNTPLFFLSYLHFRF